jgi:hypothetical protein
MPSDLIGLSEARAHRRGCRVEGHSRIALLYSGGIESSLLQRLPELWRSRITIYTPARNVDTHARTQCSYLRTL